MSSVLKNNFFKKVYKRLYGIDISKIESTIQHVKETNKNLIPDIDAMGSTIKAKLDGEDEWFIPVKRKYGKRKEDIKKESETSYG